MQPQDVAFLALIVFIAGITMIGAALVEVGFLFWLGIALMVIIGVAWLVSHSHRHGSHY